MWNNIIIYKKRKKKIIFGLIFVWQVVSIILCYNSCIETIQKYIGVKDINIIKVKRTSVTTYVMEYIYRKVQIIMILKQIIKAKKKKKDLKQIMNN